MTTLGQLHQLQMSAGVRTEAIPRVGSRPLHVSIFLQDLSGGGAERQTLTLVRELRAHGLRIDLVLHQLRGELQDQVPAGVNVVNLDRRRTRHDIVPLANFLRRHRPDILLSNIDHKNIAAALAGLLSRTRTKVVITQHNSLVGEFGASGRKYFMVAPSYRMLSPLIDAAVAVSDGIARELIELGGLPEKKVVRIYNAVIDGNFEERAKMAIAHPWLCDGQRPVFVTAGRLVPQKDHETLLRAFALYRHTGNGRLLILGVGPLRDRLEQLAQELRIAEAVDFVGFQDNPLPWLGMADLFVLSSLSEGFGIVLAEAMGCGTPVISTDSGHGPAEIVDHGRYGVLVPPRDPVALGAAMSAVDDIRRRFLPETLKARAADFSVANSVAGYLSLFDRLVPEAGRVGVNA